MNFELLSEKYKKIKSPGLSLITSGLNTPSRFFEYLKKEQEESKDRFYRFYIIYAIALIFYFSILIISRDKEALLKDRIIGACFLLAFGILIFVLKKRYESTNASIFLGSPKEFLKKYRTHYSFRKKYQLIWEIPVIILIDIALSLSISDRINVNSPILVIGMFQIIFFSLLLIGYFSIKKQWQHNKKPILLKIDKMLASFEEQ